MIFVDILQLFVGFMIIYFSVDFLLDELEEYFENFDISPVVFGVLVLGMDFEESIASIFGALEGLPLLSIGNLVGNTIIAISIAFAIPIFLIPFQPEPIPKSYYYILLVAALNLFVSLLFPSFVWIFALIAITIFAYFLFFSIQLQRKHIVENVVLDTESLDDDDDEANFLRQSIIILVALIFVIIGGELLVRSAEALIVQTQLSESFFGLVIMAFMTNVEEFWLMFQSIQKGQIELGISAQIGKIIWNTTLIFGLSGVLIRSYTSEPVMIWSGVLFLVVIVYLVISLLQSRLNRTNATAFLLILVLFFFINIIYIL